MTKKIIAVILALILVSVTLPDKSSAASYDKTITPVPVIFLHGYNDNGSSWENTTFYQWLNQSYTDTYSIDYGSSSQNDITAPGVYNKIDEVIKKIPNDQPVDIVVHSMGGLLVRYYLLKKVESAKKEDREIINRIRRVIFIQTPNRGSLQAFGGRMMDMVQHKEKYFDLKDPLVKAEYESYKELYKEYSNDMRKKLTWKHISYEHWLISKKKSDIFDKIVEWGKSSPINTIQNQVGTPALAGALQDRYTRAFEEYALLMAARLDVRSSFTLGVVDEVLKSDFLYDVKPHDTSIKPYPNKDVLDNAVSFLATGMDFKRLIPWYGDTLDNGVNERALDRLILEDFYVFDAVRDDGKQIYRTVTANPFLRDLNEQESEYRKERLDNGQYIPQYVTVASKTNPHASDLIFNLFNIGVWGVTSNERDNDLVVPVSNVSLPEQLTDRNIYLNQEASHTTFGPLVGLRDQEDILKKLFFNPLTGEDDNAITLSLNPDQPIDYTSNLMRVVIPSRDTKQTYKIKIVSEQSTQPHIYMIKRDRNQMWDANLEPMEMSYYDGNFIGYVDLTADESVTDYIFVSVDQNNQKKAEAFTLKYLPETSEISETSDADIRGQQYYIEMVNKKVDIGYSWATQQFRVIDSNTGKPVHNLNYSDFVFNDSDHSFQLGPQFFSVDQSVINAGDNIMLNLDYSNSMNGWPILQSMKAAEDFISDIKKNVNVGVMGFANDVYMLSKFTKNYTEAAKTPYTDNIHGGTALYYSVKYAVEKLSSQVGNKTLLLMTDGVDSGGSASLDEAIAFTNEKHVRVYAVGFGKEVDKVGLERLTSATGGRVFYTFDSQKLATIYNQVFTETDAVYNLTYSNSNKEIDRIFKVRMTGDRSNTASLSYNVSKPYVPNILDHILVR